MQFSDLDTDRILSRSQQWLDLQQKWGEPVDLDTLDDGDSKEVEVPSLSTYSPDQTFDSAGYIAKLKKARTLAAMFQKSLEPSEGSTGETLSGRTCSDFSSKEEACEDILKRFSIIRAPLKRASDTIEVASKVCDSSMSSSDLSFDDGEGYAADVESVSQLQLSSPEDRIYDSLSGVIGCIDELFCILDSKECKSTYL